MRGRWVCVPMMTLCLLLWGCGGGKADEGRSARASYQTMERCVMTAEVTGFYGDERSVFTLQCTYSPQEAEVEILAPETVAGVRARLDGKGMSLLYEEDCLPAGPLSGEELSPASCLPRMMSALREGWLLEENREKWNGVSCVRLALEQTGEQGGRVVSTLWLEQEEFRPVWGEVAVDGEIILQAEFTDFQFGAILNDNGGDGDSA